MEPVALDARWTRLTSMLALVALLLSTAVFVRRGAAAIGAATEGPGTMITSGCEEESFLALWRAVQGGPVYTDPTRVPFAEAYFNWLFYAGYAAPVGLVLSLTDDAGLIPLAGRLVTAGGALTGMAGLFWILRRLLPGRPLVALALAAGVFLGPLVGWWAFTVRPDVWALAFETIALGVILFRRQHQPFAAVGAAALLFYAAWACKQTYVFGLGGAVLFLLWRREWRSATLLSVISVALWAATFALMGPVYRATLRETAVASTYDFALGWSNFRELLIKGAPLGMLAAAACWGRNRHPTPGPAREALALGGLGLLVALPLGFIAGCKVGAYSNYHFTALGLFALVAAGAMADADRPRWTAAAFALMAGLQLLVLTGRAGTIDLRGPSRELAAVWSVWQRQPEPRFSSLLNLNLPWLNPASPPLVLAFNYRQTRAGPRPFEHGGLGGMIAAGMFASLLLPADTGATYDGGSLDRYRRGETMGRLTLFHRRSSASP